MRDRLADRPNDWPDNAPVGVPNVSRATGICGNSSRDGYVCSRRDGHGGRHAAYGALRSNGLHPVYRVWGDDE